MPSTSPADTNRAVRTRSSWLGVGSPLGWLCKKMTAAADSRTASVKTSRGWTMLSVKLPSDTVASRMMACLASSKMTLKTS